MNQVERVLGILTRRLVLLGTGPMPHLKPRPIYAVGTVRSRAHREDRSIAARRLAHEQRPVWRGRRQDHGERAAERADLAAKTLSQLDTLTQMTRDVLAFARGEQVLLTRKVALADFAKDIDRTIVWSINGMPRGSIIKPFCVQDRGFLF